MPPSMRSRRAVTPPIQMAAGLLLFGLAGYAFVAFTGRTLVKSEANLAIAFYFLVNVVGPGIFYALEQVTSRATSKALASGQPLAPALRRAGRAGAGLVVVVTGALIVLAPVLAGTTLHDDWALYAGVLATPAITAALSVVRGLLGGMRRFGQYAATLAIEGTARLLLCALLVLGGAPTAWSFGIAYLAASVVAVLAGLAWLRAGDRTAGDQAAGEPGGQTASSVNGPTNGQANGDHAPLAKSLAALSVATLFAQLLPNIAPLAVTSRLAQDSALALAFGQAAVVARIPLLLFFPIQTMLLPSLTAAVTRGELGLVARRVRLVLAAITGLGVLGAVLFLLLGPWVLRTFLNTTTELGALVMLLLALSTVVLIAAYAVQPALVALGKDRVVTAGWALGSAVTLAVVMLPGDPVTVAAWGQLVGPGLTLLTVLLGVSAGLRAGAVTPPQSLHVKP